jgi:hypothetical protein
MPIRPLVDRLHRPVEFIANLAIIAVAILGCALLTKQLRSAPVPPRPQAAVRPAERTAPEVGARVSVEGIDWSRRERTLVLVLSTTCHFCTESAPFYRRVASEAKRHGTVGLLAVFPQTREEAKPYLEQLGVTVDAVVQAPVVSVGTRGTPTLVLVDSHGVIKRTWVGRLAPEGESQVLDAVKATLSE